MQNINFQRTIIKEVAEDNYLKAVLYDTGIIEIIWDETIETIEILHLIKMKQAVFELGEGRKMPLLFTTHEFLDISADARKFAVTEECITYSLSIAVLIDSYAKKFLFNFFVKTTRPIIPTMGFTTREACIDWLEKSLLI